MFIILSILLAVAFTALVFGIIVFSADKDKNFLSEDEARDQARAIESHFSKKALKS